jgi:hypothetical protein
MGPLEFGRLAEDLGERLCGGCPDAPCTLLSLDSRIDHCETARARSTGAA